MQRKTMKAFAVGTLIVTAAGGTWFGCTPSDRSTAGREDEEMIHNAYEAELADEQALELKAAQAKEHDEAKPAKAEKKKVVHEAKKAKPSDKVAKAEKSTERKPASLGSVFVVQVGAFKVKENAEKLHAKLKDGGFPSELSTIEHSKNGTLHIVRFRPTQDRSEAQALVEALESKADLHAQILSVSGSH